MKVITIGKQMVALEQVAFVEPFDPTSNPDFKPEKEFKSRLILINRDIVLSEQTPEEFATENGMHLLTDERVGVNRAIVFKVETFEPTEGFKPAKEYKTRVKWRDSIGYEQSKLLMTEPETFITDILKGKVEAGTKPARSAKRPARGRNGSRRMEAFRS